MLVGAALASALGMALAVSAQAETLQQAVDMAVKTNPDVQTVAADRRAVNQEREQAKGLFLPSIDLQGSVGFERTKSSSTGNNYKDRWPNQISLTLTQMLFDGFAARSELERQTARLSSAAARVRENAEFVGLGAVQAFLEVQRQTELVRLGEQLVQFHRVTLDQMEQRARAGRGRAADVQQAAARLGLAEATLAATRGDLRNAQASYIRIVGDAPGSLEKVARPVAAFPGNLAEALRAGIEENPVLRIAKADVDVAGAEARAADAPFYPRFDFEVSGTKGVNLNGVRGANNQVSALVVARYNLYRGGIDTAAKREGLERLSEARASLAKDQRRIQEDVRTSWNAVQTVRDRLGPLRQHADRTRQVRDAYRQQFDIAARTLLDVLDAENELFNANSAVVTAEYTELFGMYRVLASMGRLLSTLSVELPAEAS